MQTIDSLPHIVPRRAGCKGKRHSLGLIAGRLVERVAAFRDVVVALNRTQAMRGRLQADLQGRKPPLDTIQLTKNWGYNCKRDIFP